VLSPPAWLRQSGSQLLSPQGGRFRAARAPDRKSECFRAPARQSSQRAEPQPVAPRCGSIPLLDERPSRSRRSRELALSERQPRRQCTRPLARAVSDAYSLAHSLACGDGLVTRHEGSNEPDRDQKLLRSSIGGIKSLYNRVDWFQQAMTGKVVACHSLNMRYVLERCTPAARGNVNRYQTWATVCRQLRVFRYIHFPQRQDVGLLPLTQHLNPTPRAA